MVMMVVVMVMMKVVMMHGNDYDFYLMIHDVHNLYYYDTEIIT